MFTDALDTPNWITTENLYSWAADLRAMCHTYIQQRAVNSDRIRLLKVPLRFNIDEGYALLTGYDPTTSQFCVSIFYLAENSDDRVLSTRVDKIPVNDIPLDTLMLFVDKFRLYWEENDIDTFHHLLPSKNVEVGDRVIVMDRRSNGLNVSYHGSVVDIVGYAVKVQVSMENTGRTDIGMIYSTTVAYLVTPKIL